MGSGGAVRGAGEALHPERPQDAEGPPRQAQGLRHTAGEYRTTGTDTCTSTHAQLRMKYISTPADPPSPPHSPDAYLHVMSTLPSLCLCLSGEQHRRACACLPEP